MSNNIYYINAQERIAKMFERYVKIKTYGLHHETSFIPIFARHLIISALLMDEKLDILTESERDCLLHKIDDAAISKAATNFDCNC